MMKTTLYLIRHAATDAHRAQGAGLQGRVHQPPLARLGVRQAELTRDFLAVRPIDHCYASPRPHSLQTASIIAAPHGLVPIPLEGLDDGDCQTGVTAAFENLLERHAGRAILVVVPDDVNRAYLAALLGLDADQARQMRVDSCGISVVVREGGATTVNTLNAAFHLQGIAA